MVIILVSGEADGKEINMKETVLHKTNVMCGNQLKEYKIVSYDGTIVVLNNFDSIVHMGSEDNCIRWMIDRLMRRTD